MSLAMLEFSHDSSNGEELQTIPVSNNRWQTRKAKRNANSSRSLLTMVEMPPNTNSFPVALVFNPNNRQFVNKKLWESLVAQASSTRSRVRPFENGDFFLRI